MPIAADGLRYPCTRVLLPRTRLAYIHLPNLLNDALRDRAARVFGYVAIWLEKELVMLYLQEGQVVTATVSPDGRAWQPVAISEAVSKVPASPEYGAICFHEAPDEQLAAMYWSQAGHDEPWPSELAVHDPAAVLSFLMSQLFDGMLEVNVRGEFSYCTFRDGLPKRGYFSGGGEGTVDERLRAVLRIGAAAPAVAQSGELAVPKLRRFAIPPALPVQAAPALIAAYRQLMRQLVERLAQVGSPQAAQIAEQARLHLVATHPVLHHFALDGRTLRDPVVDAKTLSASVAKWTADVLWGAGAGGPPPEQLLADLGRERRHLLQSAGFWEALPWRVTF